MVNGKCVDKEPNALVVSFLEMSSTRRENAVADKNMVHPKMFACSASLGHNLKSWNVFKFTWVCLHVRSESCAGTFNALINKLL